MTYRNWMMAAAVALVAMMASAAQADVFNMPAGQTSLQMVPVGNPGNVADPATGSLYGAVSYPYSIGQYDVTNAQYAEFLTDKATSSDPYGLWNSLMSSDAEGGINRSGSGPYTYTVKTGQGNQPVVDVTWYDAIRFVNWLQNGQGNGDTESGSYTLLGGTPTPSNYATISRNPGAQWVLPSENEWYKAAFYDPTLNSGSGGYWQYPTKSNTAPTSQAPAGGTNSANFYGTNGYAVTGSTNYNPSQDYLTDVGAYASSTSFYGTLDQGGNVFQWNEAPIIGSSRGVRGGSWFYGSLTLASSDRGYDGPAYENYFTGFRVASVPEPGSMMLVVCGAIAALIWWRRRG